MNLPETAQLLTTLAAFSNRTVEKSAVVAWQSVLSDVALADAEEAVRRHHSASTDWMMPAHVRRLVVEIIRERDNAVRATGWAPGQAGVPKAHPMPEISGPVAEYSLRSEIRDLLASVRVTLPEGSRDDLMPRRTYWERERRAYLRTRDAEPNPLYRPRPECAVDGDGYCQTHDRHALACPTGGRG